MDKQRFTVSTDLIQISGGVRKPTKSRRNRSKGRQLNTLNNKQNKLKKIYNKRIRASQKSKAEFIALSEEEQKVILNWKSQTHKKAVKQEPKEFFCDKYPTFESFLAVNNIKQMERTVEKTKSVSKGSYKGGVIRR